MPCAWAEYVRKTLCNCLWKNYNDNFLSQISLTITEKYKELNRKIPCRVTFEIIEILTNFSNFNFFGDARRET